ncbi:MAG: 6-phosphogluconolactonase, partial [Planctomycetota bacterium]|nr:6-phosphogluconolactonase [Planctomycetota bacterium]
MGTTLVRKVYPDPRAMSRAVAEQIVALAQERVAAAGRFTVALSGGRTPMATYELLAAEPLVARMPWAKTRVYFGDERHVPHDHPDSNCRMVSEALLRKALVPAENVFPIPTDHEDPASCAEWYEELLRIHFHRRSDRLPFFDLLLLGIGSDGHTAGIFPGTPAAAERTRWVTCGDATAAD